MNINYLFFVDKLNVKIVININIYLVQGGNKVM